MATGESELVSKKKKPNEIIDRANDVLKEYWGHDALKPAQEEVILSAMTGRDVLAILPTSYGKSATFQIPALLREGTAVIVSPLIALMKDQCDNCATRGIKASFVNSTLTPKEARRRIEGLKRGDYKIFYVAPERFKNRVFLDTLYKTNVSFIGVDECHCCSRWGKDFRPDYQRIQDAVRGFAALDLERPTVIAVTATATKDMEEEIAHGCGMEDGYKRIVGDPIRPNLDYQVIGGDPWANLFMMAEYFDLKKGQYIIYTGTRVMAGLVAEKLAERMDFEGRVDYYHAERTKDERERVQNRFKSGECPIIAATCAFGMGIDVPNIRGVIHFGIPGSLEDYCQETGRAGRDGEYSDVVLLNDPKAIALRRRFLEGSNPPYETYEGLWEFLHASLGEEECLTLPAGNIALILGKKYGIKTDAWKVGGALATMEAFGLVRRSYSEASSLLVISHKVLKAVAGGVKEVSDDMRALGKYIYENHVDGARLEKATLDVEFDRKICMQDTGMTEAEIARTLTSLQNKSGALSVVAGFKGKMVQIRAYGAELSDLLPSDVIETKREREEARLNMMMNYSYAADKAEYIRDYFLKGFNNE